MVSVEKVKKLLQAYRDFDDVAFLKTAEAIIEESLTSNKMSEARELKKALGETPKPTGPKFSARPIMGFVPSSGRNESKLLTLEESEIHSHQVVLSATTKDKINRIIQEHKNKNLLHKHGLKAKSRLLFWGPPGCGKTFTSKLLAHELGLPVAVVQINTLISSYLGDTANHVRQVFEYASSHPVVLLLDEFDAIGKTRGDAQDVGEVKRVVNSILQAFDSFKSDRSLVIAASNHQDILDEALWRRFEDIIQFPKPSKSDRETYLTMLLSGITFKGQIEQAAAEMNHLSFAEIEKIIKEAIKTALIAGHESLSTSELKKQSLQYKNDLNLAKRSTRTSK